MITAIATIVHAIIAAVKLGVLGIKLDIFLAKLGFIL